MSMIMTMIVYRFHRTLKVEGEGWEVGEGSEMFVEWIQNPRYVLMQTEVAFHVFADDLFFVLVCKLNEIYIPVESFQI